MRKYTILQCQQVKIVAVSLFIFNDGSYWNQVETEQKDVVEELEELEEFNMLKKLLVAHDKTAQSYDESTVYYSIYSRRKMQ